MVTHEINVTSDFKPKRLRAYSVPESLKPEVEKNKRNVRDGNHKTIQE